MMKNLTLAAAALLVACDTTEPSEEPVALDDVLTDAVGCSDTSLHLWDISGEYGLSLSVPGALAEAQAEGAFAQTFDADDPQLSLILEQSAAGDVDHNYCTDALIDRELAATFAAVSGSVTVEIIPSGDDNGVASVTLEEVLFQSGDADSVQIVSLVLAEISVIGIWGG